MMIFVELLLKSRIHIGKYVDFAHRNTHGYDGAMMVKLLVLAFALFGYAFTRQLERICYTDVRFMFIAQNQEPSYMSLKDLLRIW